MSLENLVGNLLKGQYPLRDKKINYELFESWEDNDNVLNYLENMANSKDYIVLHLLAYVLENMDLEYIGNHRVQMLHIVKTAMLHHCSRANFYLFEELSRLVKTEDDVLFYFDLLTCSDDINQNKGISLFQYKDIDTIKLFSTGFKGEAFSSFFTTNFNVEHIHVIKNENNLFKKIYITGLYKQGISKFQLIECINEKDNYDLMDYMYLFLDDYIN